MEHIDDSPEDFLMEGLLDMLADFYSKNLGREVIKGMKENARTLPMVQFIGLIIVAKVITTKQIN